MSGVRAGRSSKLGTHQRVLLVFLLLIAAFGSYVAFSSAKANFREVVPRKVYRSGQPSPAQLRQWAGRHGIKTVINLRGDEEQIIADERATAKELGLNMISICLSSRRLTARYLLVELIETLIGKGYQVKVYDKNVSLARLHGANRAYIEREIPHIARLMCDSMEEVVTESEVIVIGNKAPEFRQVLQQLRQDQIVIDLVRILKDIDQLAAQYEGICW